MGCGSQGVFSRLCVEPLASPHTFDTSSEPYKFDICTLGKRGKLVMARDNTGSRSRLTQLVRQGPYLCSGDIRLRPSPIYLDNWLPRILGAAEAVNVFDVAETLPVFGVLMDKVGDTEQVKDCVVSRAVFRGSANDSNEDYAEPIELILQIVGKETVTGTSYPSFTNPFGTGIDSTPFIFEEGVLTINSVSRPFYSFTLTIDNMIQVRYANQLYPTGLCPIGRSVILDAECQFTSTEAAQLFEYPDAGYASATLVFTNSSVSTTFTFAVLKAADQSPVIQGPGEIPLRLRLVALKSGSTSEIVVTNDSTV